LLTADHQKLLSGKHPQKRYPKIKPNEMGSGRGHSVLEVIECARQVRGRVIPMIVEPQRMGDPSQLIADATKAQEILG
jgi:UDP-glucose 4-epimerase